MVQFDARHFDRGRQRVVHERAGLQLSVFVVRQLLVQDPAEPLGHGTLKLALDQQRVDDRAAVVHRHVAQRRHRARLDVHLDHGHARCIRVRRIGVDASLVVRLVTDVTHPKIARGLQTRLHVQGVAVEGAFVDVFGHLGKGDLAPIVTTAHAQPARFAVDVIGRGVEHAGGHAHHLMAHFAGRVQRRRAAHEQAARTPVAQPERTGLGIALHDAHRIERHAQLVGHDLRDAGFVARAGRGDARQHRHPAAGTDPHRGALVAADERIRDAAALRCELEADPDTEEATLPPGAGLFFGETGIAGAVQRGLQRTGIVAAVRGRAGNLYVGELVLGNEILEAHRGAVHIEMLRHAVHDALHEERGRLLAEAAVGVPRRLVGDHDRDLDLAVRNFVRARHDERADVAHAPAGHRP